MKNKKFLAGEEAGTYIVPEQVTEADILDMALKLARGRLSKGRKIEQPSSAFSVILVHNHPSGDPEPSEADKRITHRLRDALSLVDIRTLDHVVVASEGCVSLAERGYL